MYMYMYMYMDELGADGVLGREVAEQVDDLHHGCDPQLLFVFRLFSCFCILNIYVCSLVCSLHVFLTFLLLF